jgi:hypothetical protein
VIPDDDFDENDCEVTEEELAESDRRFAGQEPVAPERFSRAVYGPGFRGDVGINEEPDDA